MSRPEVQAPASVAWEASSLGRGLVSEIIAGWAQGAPVDARSALAAHPELAANKSVVLDLAYEEYCRRKEDTGAAPDLDEFCERFPTFKTSLRQLIEAHRFLEESSLLPAAPAAVSWPQPGEVFLGFSLRSPLGRGAFAQVFLATEVELGQRPVVLKISLHGAAEAATLGRLRHEHIVPVYSVRQDPDTGLTAVVMPYLGSATLCDVLDRAFAGAFPTRARVILEAARAALPAGDLTPDRHPPHPLLERGTYVDGAVLLTAQLAEALALTHRRGILHRDLKPSNILLTPDGRPMLLDFNLSVDEQCTDQRLGGTLPYMAPEHLRATDPAGSMDASQVDARSDLFSLGVILFELLTGTHPFGPIPTSLSVAEVRAYLKQRQQAGPRPVCSATPQVDRSLARLIERCLAFDPKNRPQSAGELAAVLRTSLSRRRRGRRWLARHPRLVAGGLVLMLAAGAGGGYLSTRPDPQPRLRWEAGLTAYEHGQYSEAVDLFSRNLQAAPGDPQLLFARGRAYLQEARQRWVQGDKATTFFQKALEDFEQAERATPDGRVPFCIGLCRNFLSNNPQAIQAYQRALAAGFQPAAVFNNLAYSLGTQGKSADLTEAIRLLDQAIAVQPDLAVAYHNRAWVRFRCFLQVAPEKRPAARAVMVADIRRALELTPPGPATAQLYEDAARIAARAAQYEDRWDDLAVTWARQAIAHGHAPKGFKAQLNNLSNRPLFESLPNNGPPPNSVRVPRWVDAIIGIPQDLLIPSEISPSANH